jgi:hypothetical protein
MRLLYAAPSPRPASLEVDVGPGGVRHHSLRADRRAELIDLGTSTVGGLVIRAPSGEGLCVERLDLGSLHSGDGVSRRYDVAPSP